MSNYYRHRERRYCAEEESESYGSEESDDTSSESDGEEEYAVPATQLAPGWVLPTLGRAGVGGDNGGGGRVVAHRREILTLEDGRGGGRVVDMRGPHRREILTLEDGRGGGGGGVIQDYSYDNGGGGKVAVDMRGMFQREIVTLEDGRRGGGVGGGKGANRAYQSGGAELAAAVAKHYESREGGAKPLPHKTNVHKASGVLIKARGEIINSNVRAPHGAMNLQQPKGGHNINWSAQDTKIDSRARMPKEVHNQRLCELGTVAAAAFAQDYNTRMANEEIEQAYYRREQQTYGWRRY